MRHRSDLASILLAALAAAVLTAAPAAAAPADEGRNFDARVSANLGFEAAPGAGQLAAAERLRAEVPELLVTYDDATGATRSLFNAVGYLTAESDADAAELALEFARANLDLLGLSAADFEGFEVTDRVDSKVSASTFLYLRQVHEGIAVYNGQLQLNVGRGGRLLGVNNAFVPGLATAVNVLEPALSAAEAVESAAGHLGIALTAPPEELRAERGARRVTLLASKQASLEPIEARLFWLPIRRGDVRLVWNFQLHTRDRQHVYDLNVDAASGEVWTRFDWVASDSYNVYPQPVESPNHTAPPPPADARVVVANPADAAASPFAWHDTNGAPGAEFTIHRGNNVHAYDDINFDDLPPAVQPNCGAGLNCNFPLNLLGQPSTYTAAAVTNLFYWNNLIHDVQFQYGFDSPAGNFQVNTYGALGLGNDDVRAEAQDGISLNNANFFTPPDGQRPRMQMFLWNFTAPMRDGDLESSIIVHEYGHGISNRLVGGPANVNCLTNLQRPSEGLSDWWALAYTATAAQTGPTIRGIGTYVLGQPTNGTGIRLLPYSTDNAINNWTYASVAGKAVPHGVGAVWAQGAWEVYWALVGAHGFSTNLYAANGGAGNQRAMLYVNEGLKSAICNPAFTDTRDGIIQATINNYGGEDVCRVWRAFAGYGLGNDAISGGPNGLAPVNGFDVPGLCKVRVDLVSATSTTTNAPFARCNAGFKAIGGGCSDDFTSTRMRSGFLVTSPPFAFEGFACVHETNPGSLTATAICITDPGDLGLVRPTSTTGATNSPFVNCPAGKKVIGGGCSDDFTSTLLRSTFPFTNPPFAGEGWACLHDVNPGSLTVQAACIDAAEAAGLTRVSETLAVPGVPHAICPAGQKILAGGCSDDFVGTFLRSTFPTQSPPFVDEGWACIFEGFPGSLSAVGLCRAP